MRKSILVTGSCGLIGVESCSFFHEKGYDIIGIDNDMRSYYFGEEASTKGNGEYLADNLENYVQYNEDIRSYDSLEKIFKEHGSSIECVIHTAAQPSHDWADKEPHTDFGVNATGTLNLLELTKNYCRDASFIFTSTNKVYGDRPNGIYKDCEFDIKEFDTRYEAFDKSSGVHYSVDENMSIDKCKHSIFGASKVAADVMVQEYGRYYDMNTVCFRGGCLTGSRHTGAKLHGFLSYLVKCMMNDNDYTIFGYKGKQVRDNIDSWDLVNAFWHYHQNPSPAKVYNIGGGRGNSISMLEAIDKINKITGKNWDKYTISDENRIGDHIWYISNLSSFQKDYPQWSITKNIDEILTEMTSGE